MATPLTHHPQVLYHASLERMAEARSAYPAGRDVLAMYLSGLAVECVLQAIVLTDHPLHDARLDLNQWLKRSRTSLQDAIKAPDTRAAWSLVTAVWRNGLRYLSEAGLIGYLRSLELQYGIAGGPDAIMKTNAGRLLIAAEIVHAKGVAAWQIYTRK